MTESSPESANPPRRSSRISAQARPEAPTKRSRKASTADGTAKLTKAGSTRKRALKEGQEGEQDADVERDQEAKKVCVACRARVLTQRVDALHCFLPHFSYDQNYTAHCSVCGIGKAAFWGGCASCSG